jgi:hypothetical protein
MARHLGNADGADVLGVAGGAVAGAPEPRDDAADALGPDAAVDGMDGGWGRS